MELSFIHFAIDLALNAVWFKSVLADVTHRSLYICPSIVINDVDGDLPPREQCARVNHRRAPWTRALSTLPLDNASLSSADDERAVDVVADREWNIAHRRETSREENTREMRRGKKRRGKWSAEGSNSFSSSVIYILFRIINRISYNNDVMESKAYI